MRRWIVTVGILWAVSGPVHAFELTPKAQAALARGEAYAEVAPDPDGISGRVRAVVDIAAPPEKVWATMIDCRYAARLVANIASCKVLSSGAGWDVREQVTHGGPLIPGIRNVFRSDYEPYRRIRFRRVDGDLKAMDGEWGLIPLNGGRGTRVTYENRLSVRIFAPPALIRAGLRKDTPKVLENLKRLVTAG